MDYIYTFNEFRYEFVYETANPEEGLLEEVHHLESVTPFSEDYIERVWADLKEEHSYYFKPVALNIHCPESVMGEF